MDDEHSILDLLRKQNRILEEQTRALRELRGVVPTQAVEHERSRSFIRNWNDARGWAAAFETSLSEAKTRAEIWKSALDANFLFVALFVAVITAVQAPVIEAVTPDPVDTTNLLLRNLTDLWIRTAQLNGQVIPTDYFTDEPFLPKMSDTITNLFLTLSLTFSIIAAIIAVLGRQWLSGLTEVIHTSSMVERAMIQKARDDFARSWLAPALNLVQPATILSILLFMSGLLFQTWQLALSDGRVALNLGTGASSTILVAALIGLIIACLVHAVRYHHSPLPIPFVAFLRKAVRGAPVKYVEEDPEEMRESTKHLPELVERTSNLTHLDTLAPVLRSCMNQSTKATGGEEYPLNLHGCVAAMLKILESGSSVPSRLAVAAITRDHFIKPSRVISGGNMRVEREIIISGWKLLEPFEELYLQAANIKATYRRDHLEAYTAWLCHGLQCILSKEINTLRERLGCRYGVSKTNLLIITIVRLCSWLIRLDEKLQNGGYVVGPIVGRMRQIVEQELQLDSLSFSVPDEEDLVPLLHCLYLRRDGDKLHEWLNKFLHNLVISRGLDALCAFADASLLDGAKDSVVGLQTLGLLMKQIIETKSTFMSPRSTLTRLVEYLIRLGNVTFGDADDADIATDLNVKFHLSKEQLRVMKLIRLALDLLSLLLSKQSDQDLSFPADRKALCRFLAHNKRRFELIAGNGQAIHIARHCQHFYELFNGDGQTYESGGGSSVHDSGNPGSHSDPRIKSRSGYPQRVGDGRHGLSPSLLPSARRRSSLSLNSDLRGSSHLGSGADIEKGSIDTELGDGSTASKEDVELWKLLLDKSATTPVGKYVQSVLEIRLKEYKKAQRRDYRRYL